MVEENDARIERLEKESQESRAQMSKIMELIRTLIRDKGQASSPSPQNKIVQPDQRREEHVYPAGFTPPYASIIYIKQTIEQIYKAICKAHEMFDKAKALRQSFVPIGRNGQ